MENVAIGFFVVVGGGMAILLAMLFCLLIVGSCTYFLSSLTFNLSENDWKRSDVVSRIFWHTVGLVELSLILAIFYYVGAGVAVLS